MPRALRFAVGLFLSLFAGLVCQGQVLLERGDVAGCRRLAEEIERRVLWLRSHEGSGRREVGRSLHGD
jgi:hypothetical protein